MGRRVVVTGFGAVSALGLDAQTFWKNAKEGVCGIVTREVTMADKYSITLPVAPAEGFKEKAEALGRDMARTDEFSKFAAVAADEALAHSGFEITDANRSRTAVIIGSGIGGQSAMDEGYANLFLKGRRPHPLTILKTIPNAAASHISIRHELRGPSFAVSSACATGAHAIGVTASLIASGACDAGLAGATEAVITYGSLESWKAMHIVSDELCRPFSKNRRGLVIGEGAGVLMLEEYEAAKARGANILAEVAGFGMNADGKDMINPAMEGSSGAMKVALSTCGDVDASRLYINAHGTGTLMNDPTETKAIRHVFGADADKLIVSSTKSMHGHLLGAAGGIEAIAAISALNDSVIPPTINLDEPDPECDLDYAPNEAREREIDVALSNSFAFGGMNAVLAFRRV